MRLFLLRSLAWMGGIGLIGLWFWACEGGPPSKGETTAEKPITPDSKGSDTVPDQEVPKGRMIERKWTYRMIAGVSMGGGMAGMIGFRNHEKFDIIGTLGGPNDHTYLLDHIRNLLETGFCDLKKLEEIAAKGDLNSISSYCPPQNPKPRFDFEIMSHYNDWYYSDAGGNWNRSALIQVMQDLVYALGNPGYQNPKSFYWPDPSIPLDWRKTSNDERCAKPIRLKGVKHDKYNPEGKYDLITFCDGNDERNGIYRADKTARTPVEIAFAVDINGNGKRDYGEPVILMSHERYEDVGSDGCSDEREDGKGGCVPVGQTGVGGVDPNGDNYHPISNPKGTEKNLRFDEGEPYQDTGIDGVAGTGDYGEGDKTFTITPGWANFMKHDPHDLTLKMSQAALDRLNVYIDGGIRDLFNFHVTGLNLLGALRSRMDDLQRAQLHEDLGSLMPKGVTDFDYSLIDWKTKGQHVFVRYGNPKATPEEIKQGDGDHVHGGRILDRILAFMSFATAQIPEPDLEEEESNPSAKEGQVQTFVYDSKALARKNIYSVVLPPGFQKNAAKTYPVMYFGHGYGMSGPDMAGLLILLSRPMAQGLLAKMILVSVHGKCEQWLPKEGNPNEFEKKRLDECYRGTFYVNGLGFNGEGPKSEDAFFEVVSEVEARYQGRIRQPETKMYRLPIP